MPPTSTGLFLATRPVFILNMWQVVTNLGFWRLNLIPFFDTGLSSGVRPASDAGRNFDRIGHRTLNDASCFGLRSDRCVVAARSSDALDVVCFSWHGWLLDVVTFAIVSQGRAASVHTDEERVKLLDFQIIQFDEARASRTDCSGLVIPEKRVSSKVPLSWYDRLARLRFTRTSRRRVRR